jgi:hypothetical protein
MVSLRAVSLALLLVLTGQASGQPTECVESGNGNLPLPGFFDGDYALVGKNPDGGAAYHGHARIETEGCAMTLRRRIGDQERIASGGWKALDHPQGAVVLEFRDAADGAVLKCQFDVDLGNYPRLTCLRTMIGIVHSEPGLEALFPTTSWPDTAPGKRYD